MSFGLISRTIAGWALLTVGLVAVFVEQSPFDGMILIGISQLLMKE